MEYPDFHQDGAPFCQDPERVSDPEIFFPDPFGKGSGVISQLAKDVCNADGGCPYKDACLAWAVENGEPGVWGGTSENERRKLRRAYVDRQYRRPLPVSTYS